MDGRTEEAVRSRFVEVDGRRIHALEAGAGALDVVLLHGVPANAEAWRGVLPAITPHGRALAIDLLGCGRSDKPLDLHYDLATQAHHLAGALEALDVGDHVLVATDLGLIVGLHLAMAHPERLRGLVMFEGFFLPPADVLGSQPWSARAVMAMMRWRWFAERALVGDADPVARAMRMGTLRALDDGELQPFREAWSDPEVRRRVWLDGIGPHTIRARSAEPGDLADQIERSCEALRGSRVPKLILRGEPGAAISERCLARAREQLPALEVRSVGPGKHFLSLDQPEAVGAAIAAFAAELGDTVGGGP